MPFCSGDLFACRGLRKMRRCQHLGRLSRTRVGLPRVNVKAHQHLQQLLVGNFSCCAWGWIWLDNVRHGYMAISFNLHGLFSYFDLRISQGTCFGLFLDCFRLGPTYRWSGQISRKQQRCHGGSMRSESCRAMIFDESSYGQKRGSPDLSKKMHKRAILNNNSCKEKSALQNLVFLHDFCDVMTRRIQETGSRWYV